MNPDLRLPAIAVIAWLAVVLTLWQVLVGVSVLVGLASILWSPSLRHRLGVSTVLSWLIVATAALLSSLLHQEVASGGALRELVTDQAQVTAEVSVDTTPRRHQGQFGDYVSLQGDTHWVVGRGARQLVRAPVLLIAPKSWAKVEVGSTVRLSGRLTSSRSGGLAGVIRVRGEPEIRGQPGWVATAAGGLRNAIRDSVQDGRAAPRALLPALVDGDDAGLDTRTVAEFRASGLTHLTAVSGANLTLACGALLLLARWLGVRRHGLTAVAVLGILGFVVLARGEPSVVRAAAMGGAALIGLGRNGQGRGMRAWGIAVSGLVLFDPYLGVNLGFALSATATACILWLAPGWRDALCGWLPRWAAEAIAVPIAAQLGCTPLIAAISGQVSLVAVAANLLAAPVVAPATVLGLLAGVITLASATLGAVVARPALWCCEWLLFVAHRAAGLPTATLDWPTHPVSLAALTIGCLIAAMLTPILLRRPALSLLGTALLLVVICVRIPTPGWPPKGWVLVACDVGQGDGLVLNLGSGQAVVVDTGPDPDLINQCLSRLGIREIPLLILTHFHQDHVGGLDGVLRGRRVGGIEVSTLASPLAQVRRVQATAGRRGIPVIRAQLGEVRRIAGFTWQVLNPPAEAYPESESPPNDASIVMLAQVKHIRILFTGDVEPPAQAQLRRILAGHRVEVLKVAHHGSARQDQELIRGLRPSLALISVGADNDYGHPAAATLELLHQSGSLIRCTDQQGDIAVLVTSDGSLSVTSRGNPGHGLS